MPPPPMFPFNQIKLSQPDSSYLKLPVPALGQYTPLKELTIKQLKQ